MQLYNKIGRYTRIITLLLMVPLVSSCKNDLSSETPEEMIFPESLTIEKILGITWKADRQSMNIIIPNDLDPEVKLTGKLKALYTVKDRLFNSILLTKTGQVYVSYFPQPVSPSEIVDYGPLKKSIFYYEGRWTLNKDNKEELFVKVGSPLGEPLEFRLKVRQLALLNNILVMEAYCLNPDYSFSILFSGKGAQEEYWNKETDVIDPTWTDRNKVLTDPVKYSDIVGSYVVSSKDWKRVVHMDDIKDNTYPLLSTYRLNFGSNGSIELSNLPVFYYGSNVHKGSWEIKQNKVLIDFPIFPFRGDPFKYDNISEVDDLSIYGYMYSRHNVGIVMEIIKKEKNRLLVKFTEPNMCSVYVYLNRR